MHTQYLEHTLEMLNMSLMQFDILSLDENMLMWEECSHFVLHAPRSVPIQCKIVCTFMLVPRSGYVPL